MPKLAKAPVTLERLKELFDYNPTTGDFTWRQQQGAARAGDIAGGVGPIGYVYLSVDYEKIPAQRAAWFYHYGVWPEQRVGRRDGDKLNTRIDNLFLIEKDKPVVTFEDIDHALTYNAETGEFFWKNPTSTRMRRGQKAGIWKTPKEGAEQYLYIGLGGKSIPATQIAWVISYGEWPDRSVMFQDGNSKNLRLANLALSRFPPIHALENGRRVYRMTPEAKRHYGLRRYYGISVDQYDDMLAEQDGVCAICYKGETAVIYGKVKPLSVDHHHDSKKVRGLLCSSCNHMLGHARENRDILFEAVRYLDKYAADDDAVIAVEKGQIQ